MALPPSWKNRPKKMAAKVSFLYFMFLAPPLSEVSGSATGVNKRSKDLTHSMYVVVNHVIVVVQIVYKKSLFTVLYTHGFVFVPQY